MARSMQGVWSWGLCIVAAAAQGCGTRAERGATESSEASEQAYGSLRLPLVTPEQEAFRLRGAVFDIRRRGERQLTLDSDSAPGAVALNAELLQGAYEIQLRDGWALERQDDAGAPVPAALLTRNPLAFEVDSGRVTELVYSFTTDQGVIRFGSGGVSVSLGVAPPAGQAACQLLDPTSCPAGQTCRLGDETGATFCASAGAARIGSLCDADTCGVGAQCLKLDAAAQRVCVRFCDPAAAPPGCECQAVVAATGVGVCLPPPPPVCGNRRLEAGEQCDDGNRLAEDGCDQDCVSEAPCVVTTERELFITALSVVDDPVRTGRPVAGDDSAGAWTFGHLMRALSPSDAAAPALVEAMFRSWLSPQTINTFTVSARPAIQPLVLSSWPRTADGQLDLDRSPLTLNAIVNRMDLRDLADGHAGEGRFVFAVDSPGSSFPQQFTIILEYRLPARSLAEQEAWAEDWHVLGILPFPSQQYNAKLQEITERFSGRNAEPERINGSALRDVRSNEIALQSPWELREFVLAADGLLRPSRVSLTPQDAFNFSSTLANFVNQNEASILTGRHSVPESFAGQSFQAGSSFNNLNPWQSAGILNNEARHAFSLNTCNGCHGGETGVSFLQVNPRSPGAPATLSGFLTGTTVLDPVSRTFRTFNELSRRNTEFTSLVCGVR